MKELENMELKTDQCKAESSWRRHRQSFLYISHCLTYCSMHFQQYLSTPVMFLLGDFNACVGSREGNDDPWWYERGPYGHGILNDAGRELLSFLSIN